MQKGGTGKTSVTVNLAAALAAKKREVIVLDLDPQHNSSDWLEVDGIDDRLYRVLTSGKRIDMVRQIEPSPSIRGVNCIPASPMLARVEAELTSKHASEVLKSLLPNTNGYLLIDCPPSLGLLSINALAAADMVLAPAPPESMSIAGLAQLFETVETVRAHANKRLRFHVVLTRYNPRLRHAQEVEGIIRRQFKKSVLKTTIRSSVRMAESWGMRQSIFETAPKSAIAAEFRALAKEIDRHAR